MTALPSLPEDWVWSVVDELAEQHTSLAALRDALPAALGAHATAHDDAIARNLRDLLPETVALPHGRRLRVHYEADRPPWVESRLQDFFGLTDGPSVGKGRVPLVLHLLAPSGRPVQVTTDLAGFWDRHYPALRRELARVYPKHAWPEDPRTASPPAPGRLR
jgi:ATP-dependent helicase HrpB